VSGLPRTAFVVHYQQDPDNSLAAATSDFREHSSAGPVGQQGVYSLIVKPNEEVSPEIFLQDEVFLSVTVRRAGNHGQTVCLARYHRTTG
jgi:hypothetical protein